MLLRAAALVGLAAAGIATPPAPPERVSVWVAARELAPGIPVDASDLAVAAAPPGALPDGVFLAPVDASGRSPALNALVGRVPHERVLAGEPVRAERLADPARWGLSAVLPRGRRAFVVEVELEPAAIPFHTPGMEVEIHGLDGGPLVIVLQPPVPLGPPGRYAVVVLGTQAQAEGVHAARAAGQPLALLHGNFHCFDPWPWPGWDEEVIALVDALSP